MARVLVPAGPQQIHFAELCAAVQAAQMASCHSSLQAFVGVDSASALSVVSRAVQGSLPPRVPHADLLALVPQCAVPPRLYKVKAHRCPDEVEDSQLEEVLGNKSADAAAAAAREADLESLQQDAATVAEW